MFQDDDELSYAIQPLGNALFPTHAYCPSCNEVKPIKHFKVLSTNAQAKAWGYKKAIEYTSEKCNICRRPKKKLHELTLKEIHNKIVSGDIKGGAIGQMIKEDRIAQGIRKKREGVINRWKTIREQAWAELHTQADKAHDSTRKLIKAKEDGQPQDNTQLLAFLNAYLTAIKQVRTFLVTRRRQSLDSPTKGVTWSYYLSKTTKQKLLDLWTACPNEVKLGKYQPTDLLSNRLETTTDEERD